MSKLIITDVDGCILNWSSSFIEYVNELQITPQKDFYSCWDLEDWLGLSTNEVDKLAKDFNTTDRFKNLQTDYKSDIYIPLLHDIGYDFIAITACGSHSLTSGLRIDNLNNLFPSIFKEIYCCDYNYEKNSILEKLPKSSYWIEDHYHNCKFGTDKDHTCFLMNHSYNNHIVDDSIIKVSNWEEIYHRIISI